MLHVRFDIHGEEQYTRAFKAFEHEMDDLREPLGGSRDILVRSSGEQFQTEGAHGLGTKWTPLNKGYERQKEERYPGQPMLVASGKMRSELLTNGTIELNEKRLVWGIKPEARNEDGTPVHVYAEAHQTGKGVVPQRKIIALTLADRRDMDREFVTFISTRRRALGLG